MREKQLLIVRPDSIGDYVLFSGTLRFYRELYPDYHITILLQSHIAELAETSPYLDAIIPFDRARFFEDPAYTAQLVESIRVRGFSCAIYPVDSREPLGDFLTLESGADVTITFEGNNENTDEAIRLKNNASFAKLIPCDSEGLPELSRNRQFVQKLSGKEIREEDILPNIRLKPQDEETVLQFLKRESVDTPFFALAPFSQNPIRKWEVTKWCELIDAYPEIPMFLLGSSSDEKEANEIILRTKHEKIFNLCGTFNLRENAALLEKAALHIGVETALFHLATTFETPSLVITGGGHFGRFIPWSSLQQIVHKKMFCYGCNWKCYRREPYCLQDITVEDLTTEMNRLGYAPSFQKTISTSVARRYFTTGSFYKRIAKKELACHWLRLAVAADDDAPVVSSAYFHLGELEKELGNEREAEEAFRSCLERNPEHQKAKSYLKETVILK